MTAEKGKESKGIGIISCFIIISGILIWLVARDKKSVAEKKRKFNAWIG